MKSGLAVCVAICSLTLSAEAQEDSVYVNLSALDALDNSQGSVLSSTEPLFPVISRQKAVKAQKAGRAKSSRPAHKNAPKQPEAKIAMPKKSPEINMPALEKPTAEASAAVEPQAGTLQEIPYVESNEAVVVVDVEPIAPTPAAEIRPADVSETETPVDETLAGGAPSEEISAQTASADEAAALAETAVSASKAKLLVDDAAAPAAEKVVPPAADLGKLVFEADSDELTDEHKAAIDMALASFSDAVHNKIAIYSYNLDDGVDTFRKKRLSLNRAVEVRGYLLPKGYKNFSIKVINVDAESDKGNTVVLEELK